MARAKPSWAIWAILVVSALVNGALVATAPIVVLAPAETTTRWPFMTASIVSRKPRPLSARAPARISPVRGWRTSPTALTATIAPTTTSVPGTRWLAVPRPPLHGEGRPEHLAHRRARASPDVALPHRPSCCGQASLVARLGVRPDREIA